MTIKINISKDENGIETIEKSDGVKIKIIPTDKPEEPKGIKIEIVKRDKIEFTLNSRSALNGDLMILDHKDIDIILKQKEAKVITFAKGIISDYTYGAEARLLEHLRNRGILEFDSIQGGNIYGSLEGKLMTSDKIEVNKLALAVIAEWMEEEQRYIQGTNEQDNMEEEGMLNPDGEYSTELGEVPAEEKKGSILQHNLFAPYLYGRYTYE